MALVDSIAIHFTVPAEFIERIMTMPESVPPKETARAADVKSAQSTQGQGVAETEQVPGQPRGEMGGPAANPPARVGAAADDHPGGGFVRVRWKTKIGGHEQAEEWAEERRARNLVGSGHAEIIEKDKGKG